MNSKIQMKDYSIIVTKDHLLLKSLIKLFKIDATLPWRSQLVYLIKKNDGQSRRP